MMQRSTVVAIALLVMGLGLVACGSQDQASETSDVGLQSAPTEAATTNPPTTTSAAPTTTTSTTTTTTTTLVAAASDLPTYSEVVAAEWPGEKVCGTQAGISGGPEVLQFGPFGEEGATTSIREGFPMGFCPGARYIVAGELTLATGAEFPIGTLLTLDSELNFVAVSSWD